jgi:hypothetical protein
VPYEKAKKTTDRFSAEDGSMRFLIKVVKYLPGNTASLLRKKGFCSDHFYDLKCHKNLNKSGDEIRK